MTEPAQKPHRSKQDYGTPPAFIDAVERRFGALDIDLAARVDNKVAPSWVDVEEDSLAQPWRNIGLGWLNPPFANLGAWASKCRSEAGPQSRILMLSPASVGTEWWAEHVHGHASVLFLRPRLTFVGCSDPYPKDLALSCYGFGVSGYDTWRWKC